MKEKKLLKALTDVKEGYIEEAAPPAKKPVRRRSRWLKWGGMAACLVLAVSVVVTVPGMLFSGCGAGSKMSSSAAMDAAAPTEDVAGMSEDKGYAYDDADMDAAEEAGEMESAATTEESGSDPYQRADVKLIRRASLELETLDFDASVEGLDALVESLGGYTENSSLYQGSYGSTYRSMYYTVRIPSERYDEFLNQVSSSANCHLVSRNESTEDVGQEYFDTETRLETLRTKLERLEALLKKAEKMEDIIELETAISDTEYQINKYTTTLNRYNSLIGYATFEITIEEVSVISDTDALGFGERMGNAVKSGWQDFVAGMETLLLGIAGAWPVLVILAVIAGVVGAVIWRRKK